MSAVAPSRRIPRAAPSFPAFLAARLALAAGVWALACSLPGPALAQGLTGEPLAKKMQCLACHQVDKRRVGPSFKLVAQRYADREGGEDYLAYAVRHGGRGSWGAIPMPEQPQVSDEDARLLAQWILSLAPAKEGGR